MTNFERLRNPHRLVTPAILWSPTLVCCWTFLPKTRPNSTTITTMTDRWSWLRNPNQSITMTKAKTELLLVDQPLSFATNSWNRCICNWEPPRNIPWIMLTFQSWPTRLSPSMHICKCSCFCRPCTKMMTVDRRRRPSLLHLNSSSSSSSNNNNKRNRRFLRVIPDRHPPETAINKNGGNGGFPGGDGTDRRIIRRSIACILHLPEVLMAMCGEEPGAATVSIMSGTKYATRTRHSFSSGSRWKMDTEC
mmetsp:Transcript_7555/g.20949  ORF Transcript_7555/g.20949 Transcript_7555/m.20949 type:complete len:249 (-) Transcript_7555:2409-3155(-)